MKVDPKTLSSLKNAFTVSKESPKMIPAELALKEDEMTKFLVFPDAEEPEEWSSMKFRK